MHKMAAKTLPPIPEWRIEPSPIPYEHALEAMEARVAALAARRERELIWLVEHPAVITAGTSSQPEDLRDPGRFPVHRVGRGGRLTYHGPGQRLIYPILDLGARGGDVRAYVAALEEWVIAALARLGVEAFRSAHGVGIWVMAGGTEAKIAAIGVRIRRWISFHGVAINVSTNLEHYGAIVPCGIRDRGVTRLADLGVDADMAALDSALFAEMRGFIDRLGPVSPPRMKPLEDCPKSR